MMNFGFKLAKPAESDIGIAMRLWQSNSASWRVSSSSIDDRINAHITSSNLPAPLRITKCRGIGFVREVTNKVKSWAPHPNIRYMLRLGEPVKQCKNCAKLGYHSVYFMLPWLQSCPVHLTPLKEFCETCGHRWPNKSNVSTRNCEGCSARTLKSDLVSRKAYNVADYERGLAPLEKLLTSAIRSKSYRRKHAGHLWTARADESAKLLSIPSTLVYLNQFSEIEKSELIALGVPVFDCYHYTFDLEFNTKENPYRFTKQERLNIAKVRKKILKKAKLAISNLRDEAHRYCRCKEFDMRNFTPCLYCEMLRVLLSSDLTNGVSSRRALFNHGLRLRQNIKIDDPGIVREITLSHSETGYCIPLWISMIIYSVDLWMIFRQIAICTSYYSSTNSSKTSLVTMLQDEHRVLQVGLGPLAHFHIYIKDDKGHLIFPKSYLDRNLEFSEELLYLTGL